MVESKVRWKGTSLRIPLCMQTQTPQDGVVLFQFEAIIEPEQQNLDEELMHLSVCRRK